MSMSALRYSMKVIRWLRYGMTVVQYLSSGSEGVK